LSNPTSNHFAIPFPKPYPPYAPDSGRVEVGSYSDHYSSWYYDYAVLVSIEKVINSNQGEFFTVIVKGNELIKINQEEKQGSQPSKYSYLDSFFNAN